MPRLDIYKQNPVFSSPLLPSVVRAILRDGPISRAQIARQARLSKQTSSELISALEDLGWVREAGMLQGEVGRRAVAYEFDPRSAYVLGIDLGGTKLHVALADHSGRTVIEEHVNSDSRGGRDLVRQIGEVADAVASRSGIDRSRLLCATIGLPGSVERDTGRILLSPNIPGFDTFDVVSALREALGGLHVLVENDVNLAAVGESWNGLGRACDDIAFVALGTGIGMGLVSDGRLLRGARGAAGEISYLPLGSDPFDPDNVARGTLEAAIGSKGIVRRYQAAGGEPQFSVKDIFEALPHDLAAKRVVDDTARILALALAAVVALVDPKKIVLGGSIGVRPELVDRMRLYLAGCVAQPPEVTVSRFHTGATIMGAVAVALDEVHRKLFGVHSLGPGLIPRIARDAAPAQDDRKQGGKSISRGTE